jgi:hypothetical protein
LSLADEVRGLRSLIRGQRSAERPRGRLRNKLTMAEVQAMTPAEKVQAYREVLRAHDHADRPPAE